MTKELVLATLLEHGPMSGHDLADLLGMGRIYVNKKIRRLRDAGQVHLSSYRRQPVGTKGRCIPVYAHGPGKDAKPPKALEKSTYQKRYYERHKAVISARRYTVVRDVMGVWAGLVQTLPTGRQACNALQIREAA